ncbi:D-2-hydroxyacid dehydrogenase [Flavobacteriaceae bacterium F89]|uniref:D-2-hydroxyacid dehydrogenase n=1 Tax=Cerina litoralis TaxID=2874477 RepID=A0AAE3EXU9_9FLAO|nr:D-2-hydroxyacid dehydrogenase [Cerina litoralis]MCG2462258.1 D-2-hydroxyacid dehydrogenase [Cerina litoralis]
MKIFCALHLTPLEKSTLIDQTKPDVTFFQNELDPAVVQDVFRECEVVFGNPPSAWLEKAPNLKWVQLASAGLDPYQEIIREGKIKFSNLKGFYDAAVTETAIGGLLMLLRKLHILHRAQIESRWIKPQVRLETQILAGKQVLILGMGAIGKSIKRCLRPFGVRFLGNAHFPRNSDSDTIEKVEDNIKKCDVLIACLPEIPETVRFLSEDRLKLLRQTSLIINVGRGSLIDESALISLLKKDSIAGAFLDVTQQEPIPKTSPLWDAPNLILNQHTGGSSKDEAIKQVGFIVKNYRAYKKGRAQNLIEP